MAPKTVQVQRQIGQPSQPGRVISETVMSGGKFGKTGLLLTGS